MVSSFLSQSGFSMDRLANFCAVADAGSIAAVVEKGDSSRQSLMSRQIRELESFFGVELVRRKGRGLEITEAGRELAAIGRQNFNGLADYAARCRGREWSVRIVASNSIAQWLLLPRLKTVADAQPNVKFEIFHEQTREMVAGTREGTYDVAFVRKDALAPGLKHAVLGEIGHSLFIPVSIAKKAPKSVGDALATVPMALPIGGWMREKIERMAGARPFRVTLACTSYLQAAEAVRAGMCAAVLPDTALSSLQGQRLHRLPLPDRFTLCLAWTPRNVDTRPALGELIATLKAKMAVE
ncbi:MAG: LysR family transcriptional regulator [Verrucomicrobiota bacterium]